MRLKRKLKRTTKQYIIVALICIVVIGGSALTTSIIAIRQMRDEYEYLLSEAELEMNENKKSVYVAVSDIGTGEILTEDMVEKRTVYSSQPADTYISKDDLGKAIMIDISEGTYIVKGMLADNPVSSELREIEYDVIHISSNIGAKDYVDIRIFYPNGENFIVMSKKSLIGFQPGTPICYLWVDEEELLRMSAAIVDAALYPGSKLFMTRYIEPSIQDASVITYVPNISVLSLIEQNPNIVERCSQLLNKEVRKAMENRLASNFGLDVSSISWDLEDINTGYVPIYDIADIPGMEAEGERDTTGEISKIREEAEEVREEAEEIVDKAEKVEDEAQEVRENVEHIFEYEYDDAPGSPELGTYYNELNYYFATEG